MCTAISFQTKDHYFGRNLDLEYHYNESVTITPNNFHIQFRNGIRMDSHAAIIGMATVVDGYPLYYDATNEYGLSAAGLNFPENAHYQPPSSEKKNIAPFELIPWVLTQCKTTTDAEELLKRTNITDTSFNPDFPNTPLHWMISDRQRTIVVEPSSDGIAIYHNDVCVLTNNPPFPYHRVNLCNYLNVTSDGATNRFTNKLELHPYSRGMGGIGLPGDLSSASRFVRAAFTKLNSVCEHTENESVQQFFHILETVAQTRGCAKVNDAFEITLYSSCCNTDKGIYYYKTYNNPQITAIHLHHDDLDNDKLICYPLRNACNLFYEN